MRKARSFQVFFFLMLVFIILMACNLPGLKSENYTISEPDPQQLSVSTLILEPTYTLQPTHTFKPAQPLSSRCELFSEDQLSLTVLSIDPGDASVLVYTKFPQTVIGLEDQHDDGLPWLYTASIGESTSVWCELFEGATYSGRLYCLLPLPSEYKNTAQPFNLFVNGCDVPVFSVVKQSLMVEKPSASGGGIKEDHSGQIKTICGPEPSAYPACNLTHEQWCYCMGGFYTCELSTVFLPVKGYCYNY